MPIGSAKTRRVHYTERLRMARQHGAPLRACHARALAALITFMLGLLGGGRLCAVHGGIAFVIMSSQKVLPGRLGAHWRLRWPTNRVGLLPAWSCCVSRHVHSLTGKYGLASLSALVIAIGSHPCRPRKDQASRDSERT